MIRIRLYANLREIAGREVSVSGEEAPLREILERLFQKRPALRDAMMVGGELRPHFNLLLNGRNVLHLEGLETRVRDGDEVAIFPPVAGGARIRRTLTVRGVPRWALEQYLLEMGAESMGIMYRCKGEDWSAEIIEKEPGSLNVHIAGSRDGVQRAEEKLKLKCLRAGG
jgi:molybdopterin synthase sulfur carrier subunit